MPRMYPATVHRQIVLRLRSGEPVAVVAADTSICQAALCRWKRQALIDAGVIEGIPNVGANELAAAHKRIAALEAELALTRDACELFDERAVVPPKGRRAIAEGLIARGHSARSACRITGLARSLLQYHRRRPVPDRQIRRLIVADIITRSPPAFAWHIRASSGPRRFVGRLRHERQPQVGRLDHGRKRSVRTAATWAASAQPDPGQHPCRPGEPAVHRDSAQRVVVHRHRRALRP